MFSMDDRNLSCRIKQPAECYQHIDGPNRNGSHEDLVMAKRPLPSPEVLRQLLRYEPETGKLFWKERGPEWFQGRETPAEYIAARWNSKNAGNPALNCISSLGYKKGAVLDIPVMAHRVIWAIEHGHWPEFDIDHINGDRSDNRDCNLREATRAENLQNVSLSPRNKSGFPGVSWCSTRKKWGAKICKDKVYINLGRFDRIEDAAEAYRQAKSKLHTFCPKVRT